MSALEQLEAELNNIDEICFPSANKRDVYVSLLKSLYDYSSTCCSRRIGPLTSLHVDHLDLESIWEEIQTRNRPMRRFLEHRIKKLHRQVAQMAVVESGEEETSEESDDDNEVHSEEEGEEERSLEVDEDTEDEDMEVSDVEDSLEEEDEVDAGEAPLTEEQEDEMEKYLDHLEEEQEKRMEKMEKKSAKKTGHKGAVEDESDSEDELDVEKEMYGDSDEEGGEEEENWKYEDFFGTRAKKSVQKHQKEESDSDDEMNMEMVDDYHDSDAEETNSSADSEEISRSSDGSNSGSDDESDESSDEENSASAPKSASATTPFEQRQERLRAQIAALEEEMLQEKRWDMRGEIRSSQRPENSLLDIVADVERASKPTPIITQEFTKTVEDMIIQRIKDGRYDDVVAKAPVERVVERTVADVSQEKSKVALGEIYAEQFLKQTLNYDKENPAILKHREETLAQFQKVCRQLDSLSHFHFTPKPVVQEISVAASVPSLSKEDIAPTTESSAAVVSLAPEEVREKKRGRDAAFVADVELTREDKKRVRRASKAANKKHKAEEAANEAVAARKDPILRQKLNDAKLADDFKNDRRVVTGKESGKSSNKSADFFSKLQAQAQSDIKKDKAKLGKASSNDAGAVKTSSNRVKL